MRSKSKLSRAKKKDPLLIKKIIQKKAKKAIFKKATAEKCASKCEEKLNYLHEEKKIAMQAKLKKLQDIPSKSLDF